MINEINLVHTVVLIWCCIFKRLFSWKNTDTQYWYSVLNTDIQYFLNTDIDTASVFFKLNTDTDTSVFENHTGYWILFSFCNGQVSGWNSVWRFLPDSHSCFELEQGVMGSNLLWWEFLNEFSVGIFKYKQGYKSHET